MGKRLTIAGLAGALLLVAPAAGRADELSDQLRDYFHVQGDKLQKDIDELLRSIPRFEAPTVDEDGNIIIRRKPPLPPGADPWTGEMPPQDPDFANI